MVKKNQNDVAYIARLGLVETRDAEIDRPILRKPGFGEIRSFGEMEAALSKAIRARRTERGLTREQLAMMIGLSTQVFGRYEKAISKMHVTRLIHLCEILDISAVDMIYAAAPNLFGDTPKEAELRANVTSDVLKLPAAAVAALHGLITTMMSDWRPCPTSSDREDRVDELARQLGELDRTSADSAIVTALQETIAARSKDAAHGGQAVVQD